MALRSYAVPGQNRLRRLMWLAYMAAGLVAVATGCRDPDGMRAVLHQAAPQGLILPLGILLQIGRAHV